MSKTLSAVVTVGIVVLAWMPAARGATLLSSVDLPGQPASVLGGGTFSSSPSPRGASIPVPLASVSLAADRNVPERPASPKRKPPAAEVEPPAASKPKPKTAARSQEVAETPKPKKTSVPQPDDALEPTVVKAKPKAVPKVRPSPAPEKPADLRPEPSVAATEPEAEEEEMYEDESKSSPGALVSTAGSIWTADFGWGWYNKYYFRGVNVLKSVAPDTIESGVINSKVTLAYSRELDAFSVGFGYVQALGRQLPRGAAADLPPNSPEKKAENFKVPSRERYNEYNFYAAYTRQLIQGKLQGTLGFNHYQFANGLFWKTPGNPIPFADEGTVRLDYIGLPYIRPSITWAHDFNGFEGDYLDMRIDGGFDLVKQGDFGVRIEPYVAVSYDMEYNGSDSGWNALETGLSMPIRLNEHFTVTLTGSYTKALEDSNGQPRVNPGFWGGVVFNAAWGGSGSTQSILGEKEVREVVKVPGEDLPWELSGGMGLRRNRYTFSQPSVSEYDPTKVYKPKFRTGDIGLARRGTTKVYEDGAVFAGGNLPIAAGQLPVGTNSGTSDFRFDRLTQVTTVSLFGLPQVRFTSNDYSYAKRSRKTGDPVDDDDTTAYPYLSLDRELLRKGAWSLRGGLLYSFMRSDGDSGLGLTRIDSLFELNNKYGYLYPLDAISTNTLLGNGFDSRRYLPPSFAAVVIDPTAYARSYATIITPQTQRALMGSAPQEEVTTTLTEVAKIATYVRTSVDITSNTLELPFSLRRDFGRLHAEVKASPTFTFMSGRITSDIYRQSVETSAPQELARRSAVPRVGRILLGGAGGGPGGPGGGNPIPGNPLPGGTVAPIEASVSTAPPETRDEVAESSAPSGGVASGKAGNNTKNPQLPGEAVGYSVVTNDASDVLFGVAAAVSLVYDLNEEGTFFAEVWGRYRWSDSFELSNRIQSVDFNNSGFEAGLGVGVRF